MLARPSAQSIGVAVTIAAALGLVGYFSTLLLWEDIRPWRHYKVAFRKTGGLQKKDDVFVHGLIVGRVGAVKLWGDRQLAELQVEPEVVFFRQGTKIQIESIDAFGNVAIFAEPGDPATKVTYGPDDVIEGTYSEGFSGGPAEDQRSGSVRLSDAIKDFEEGTNELLRPDSGKVGRLLNDPDLAVGLRDGLERFHETAQSLHEATRALKEGDEGIAALVSPDAQARLDDASRRLRDVFDSAHEGLRAAARGEPGFAGRFVGDAEVRESVHDAVKTMASLLVSYRTGDPTGTTVFTHSSEPAERITDVVATIGRVSSEVTHGEGPLANALGPGSGQTAREGISNLGRIFEGARSADATAGSILSPSASGRREVEDLGSRIEDVLREMRGALVRIRADQTPNTFQGAIFSVF